MIDVAILGATGTVGQKFILLLEGHPQFRVKELVASEHSAGKLYNHACLWKQSASIPHEVHNLVVKPLYAPLHSKIVFSGLDSSVAGDAETHYAQKGHIVISNSKNHRMEASVPLVIPEVNIDHLSLAQKQSYEGAIITNPNCATIGMCTALAPLHKQYGIQKIFTVTMQAISGAGYPGVSAIDITNNVIPYIQDEEEKIAEESKKIFGTLQGTYIENAHINVSAHCNRVPVIDGHTAAISVQFQNDAPPITDIIHCMKEYTAFPQQEKLYSAPLHPIIVHHAVNRPQPAFDLQHYFGMAVSVGRIRPCNIFDIRMTVLSHNTIRGAAGTAILNAESYIALGHM